MTGPEKKLWAILRAHRLAQTHFRRQTPIGEYIVDFAAHGPRVVVGVDGDQHDQINAIDKDLRRDAVLAARGYHVLRFSNWQVLNEFDSVAQTIEAALLGRAPSLPSPGAGEGEHVADL